MIGRSPAVGTLASLARVLGWRATVVDDEDGPAHHPDGIPVRTALDLTGLDVGPRTAVVVATQGHYDEQALAAALATDAGYVGPVASRRRAEAVLGDLQERGTAPEVLQRVRAPAGIDLGEIEHDEIALAILAELVSRKAAGKLRSGVTPRPVQVAIDPVCGMEVDVGAARHRTDHEGNVYLFCAAGCQRHFEADPRSSSPSRIPLIPRLGSRGVGRIVSPAATSDGADR